MGWVFLISWIVVGLLLFSGNKNAKRQGHVNRYSPVVILGGSFIVALIIMAIYGSFFEPPKASSPSTPQKNAAKQEISTTANSQMQEKAQLRDSYFGDFIKAKIEKKTGKSKLQVWEPHIKYSNTLLPLMKETMLSGVEKLEVEYDEVWKVWEDRLDSVPLSHG